jgi:hypothetical protein
MNISYTHLSLLVVSSARTTCHRRRKSSTIIWTFVLSGGCDRPTISRHAIPMLLIVLQNKSIRGIYQQKQLIHKTKQNTSFKITEHVKLAIRKLHPVL